MTLFSTILPCMEKHMNNLGKAFKKRVSIVIVTHTSDQGWKNVLIVNNRGIHKGFLTRTSFDWSIVSHELSEL